MNKRIITRSFQLALSLLTVFTMVFPAQGQPVSPVETLTQHPLRPEVPVEDPSAAPVSSVIPNWASVPQQDDLAAEIVSVVVAPTPVMAGEQITSTVTTPNWTSAPQQDDVAGEIISIVVSPDSVAAGEQAVFTVTIRNTGTTTWDPTVVEAEVTVSDEQGTPLATGWGADATPLEAVAPGAEASVVAYLQVPRDWQGTYQYTVKLWYLSALMDSYTGEGALLEVSPVEGPIEAYEDDAFQWEEDLFGMQGGGGQAVDIVFAMDTSGSMSDEFSALCTKIDDVVQELQDRGVVMRHNILGIHATRECATDYVSNLIPGATSNHIEDWGPATYDLSHGYCDGPGSQRACLARSGQLVGAGSRPLHCSVGPGPGGQHGRDALLLHRSRQ